MKLGLLPFIGVAAVLLSGQKASGLEDFFELFEASHAAAGLHSSGPARKPVLYFVTGNKRKLEEVNALMGGEDSLIEIKNIEINLEELQAAPHEVSLAKARLAYSLSKKPVIVEDTSLAFNAMKGLPGPYIKWFLKKVGVDGLHTMLQGFEDKTGYAQTIFSFFDGHTLEYFDGRVNGTIVAPRGDRNMGWDPIFLPDGSDITFGEMTREQFNAVSQRRKAVDLFKEWLAKEITTLKLE